MAESHTRPRRWWLSGQRWQVFGAAVLLVALLPLLPLILERCLTGAVTSDAVMLTVVLYSVPVMLLSANQFVFCLFIVVAILAAVFYAFAVLAGESSSPRLATGAYGPVHLSAAIGPGSALVGGEVFFWVLAGSVVLAVWLLFNRHVAGGERLILFAEAGD